MFNCSVFLDYNMNRLKQHSGESIHASTRLKSLHFLSHRKNGYGSGPEPTFHRFTIVTSPTYPPRFVIIRQHHVIQHCFFNLSMVKNHNNKLNSSPGPDPDVHHTHCLTTNLTTKLRPNPSIKFWETVLPNKQTNEQRERQWWKYNHCSPSVVEVINHNASWTCCGFSKSMDQTETISVILLICKL